VRLGERLEAGFGLVDACEQGLDSGQIGGELPNQLAHVDDVDLVGFTGLRLRAS
jgi:hypothetical protein